MGVSWPPGTLSDVCTVKTGLRARSRVGVGVLGMRLNTPSAQDGPSQRKSRARMPNVQRLTETLCSKTFHGSLVSSTQKANVSVQNAGSCFLQPPGPHTDIPHYAPASCPTWRSYITQG